MFLSSLLFRGRSSDGYLLQLLPSGPLDFGLPYWDYPLGKESNRGHAQRGRHTHDRKNSSELEYLSAARLRLPHPSPFSAPRACKIRASAVRLGSDSSAFQSLQ